MIPQRLGHILSDAVPGVLMFILVSIYEDGQFKISNRPLKSWSLDFYILLM